MSPKSKTTSRATNEAKPAVVRGLELPQLTEDNIDEANAERERVNEKLMQEIPAPGTQSGEADLRHSTPSREGRRVITLKKKSNDNHCYVDVEPFGDPDLYGSYLTKEVPKRPDLLDVNVNGDWVRLTIEEGPLTVPDHVE